MPALLIIIMVLVAVRSSPFSTSLATHAAGIVFVLFAVILGAREVWIQREGKQLTSDLMSANEKMQVANNELRLSELRFRELNAALEQRVTQRTEQLKSAYDELEGFSYAVAHDLKAPLRAINGFSHLLSEQLSADSPSNTREYLDRLRGGSLRMASLIDDLLAYSQIDRRGLQAQDVSLRELVDSIIAPHADEIEHRGIDLFVDVPLLTFHVDAEGLALALRNLIENALKYTRDARNPRIEIRAQRLDSISIITVKDNGIGFDMQFHEHIFKVFHRLHREDQYPGTGIGLALVRKAIARVGGRVWAESKPGAGATFFVELPLRGI